MTGDLMIKASGDVISRRRVLALTAGAAATSGILPIRISLAQGTPQAGQPLPPLSMECYPDQMTVEASRVYARELAELGIQLDPKPLDFGQILGKVYGRKDLVAAMMG